MIEKLDAYKTRVVGYGVKLNKVRTPDGVLHVDVRDVPNCTWELEGDCFYCMHDEFEVEEFSEDHIGINGHYQTESLEYVCSECGEVLEGSPEEDSIDEDWEYEKSREH